MSEQDKKNEFETALEMFPNADSKLRLEEVKRRFSLHDQDAVWLYICALENYQRLYESAPQHIKDAAEAETKRLKSETSNIIARAEETISSAAQQAAVVAQQAANQAAQELVRKIDKAVLVKAQAEAWRYRMGAIAGALGLAASAATMAAVMTSRVPSWVVEAHSNHSDALVRLVVAAWNAPVGWVICLCLFGAIFACLAEDAAIKTAERLARERP